MKRKIIAGFIIVFIVFLCFKFDIFPPTKRDIQKVFYKFETELTTLCNFLNDNYSEDVRIDLFDSINDITIYTDNNNSIVRKSLEINNDDIIQIMKKLDRYGFVRILKEDNYIYFQIWGSFDQDVGLMYSKGDIPNITEVYAENQVLEKMNTKDWFYYSAKYVE